MTQPIYCSFCSYENTTEDMTCHKCGRTLHNPHLLNVDHKINTIDELFTPAHESILRDSILSLEIYEIIIQNIIETGDNNLLYKKNMTTKQRVFEIARAYTRVTTKTDGKNYGQYVDNTINIDTQFDTAEQISTVLHELTHYLFNEIIKQILMYLWNIKESTTLDAYIQTTMAVPLLLLTSEYCASSTERAYLDEEFVSFSSFNSICEDISYNPQMIQDAVLMGKSMSESIIKILDNFIDDHLAVQIKKEFIKNNTKPNAKPICINDTNILNNEILRNTKLMELIYDSYEIIKDKKDAHKNILNGKKRLEQQEEVS